MSTLNLGKLRFNWRGVYDSAQTYTRNDTVKYQQNSFVCITDTTTGTFNGSHWAVMAEGMHPATTEGDLLTFESGNLVRKPIGAEGQVVSAKAGKASWEYSPVIQTRMFQHFDRQQVDNGGTYVFGGNPNITLKKADSVLLVTLNLFSEPNEHNTSYRVQYSVDNGANWYNMRLPTTGQNYHGMFQGYEYSGDYSSTPSHSNQELAAVFNTTSNIRFRLTVGNGSSVVMNGSWQSGYETAPSMIKLTELNADFNSITIVGGA